MVWTSAVYCCIRSSRLFFFAYLLLGFALFVLHVHDEYIIHAKASISWHLRCSGPGDGLMQRDVWVEHETYRHACYRPPATGPLGATGGTGQCRSRSRSRSRRSR
eukprot:scaffold25043_cov157-Isochrysis_galbana.AAC.2